MSRSEIHNDAMVASLSSFNSFLEWHIGSKDWRDDNRVCDEPSEADMDETGSLGSFLSEAITDSGQLFSDDDWLSADGSVAPSEVPHHSAQRGGRTTERDFIHDDSFDDIHHDIRHVLSCELSYEEFLDMLEKQADKLNETAATQLPSRREDVLDESMDNSSLRKPYSKQETKSVEYEQPRKCFRWFGHGKCWTIVAIAFAWIGTGLSISARQSLEFVKFRDPLIVGSQFEPVKAMGLIRMQLCLNASDAYDKSCNIVQLELTSDVDRVFIMARMFISASAIFGSFFTFFLTTAIIWETINLRPIGFGFLLTYFLQSFTMLFFDANVCKEQKCTVATGCLLSVLASFCWVGACLSAAKMDAFKIKATRRRRRRAKRRAKRALAEAQKKLQEEEKCSKNTSSYTQKTISTSSESDASSDLDDVELGIVNISGKSFRLFEC